MGSDVSFREIVVHAIGGGWGKDAPFEGSSRVAIIRGTDFQNIETLDYAAVPQRHEDTKKAQRRRLQPGDVILEVSGGSRTSNQSTGRTLLVTCDLLDRLGGFVIPASFCRRLRFDTDRVHSRYAFYALQDMYHSKRAEQYEVQSTGISNFQFEYFLDNERVRVPSLQEQHRIAATLGALDDKIELNRRMNATLEAMARAIFKSWFIDFDPVRAKAEGRTPPGLDPATAALFPDGFQDSDMGLIPEGWDVRPIGHAVCCVGGTTPSTKEPTYWERGTHPFATPRDMSHLDCPVLLDTERHITDAGVARISSGKLPAGTVLLSSRAPIGYLAITETSVSVNQGIIAMICDGPLPNHYVLHWTRENMDVILANAGGTTFAEISKRNFRPIAALVPPAELLDRFVREVKPLHQRMVSNLQEGGSLAAIRDSLLPKLLSGEIPIPDTDRFRGVQYNSKGETNARVDQESRNRHGS